VSLARLFLSGLLVAWGLILGAFTLHGYFDPNWQQRQVQTHAASVRPSHPAVINTFKNRSRFVASRAEPASPSPTLVARTTASAPSTAEGKADAKMAAKPAPKKKLAEKTKQRPQQASAQWPWSLFSN
jgi:hypothetical protein